MMPIKEIPKENWPAISPAGLVRFFKTDELGIQEYKEKCGTIRLTIHKLKHKNGKWLDGITWDQLQHAKRLVGYANKCAVEIYPADKDVVNVANMRHLWIVDAPSFTWRAE